LPRRTVSFKELTYNPTVVNSGVSDTWHEEAREQGREGAGKQRMFLFSVPLFLDSRVLEDLGSGR